MTAPLANSARVLILALMLAGGATATELPDLGEVARAGLSESRESALGRQIMRQIRADRDYLDDAEINDYLNELGERLAGASVDAGYHLRFFAVRDDSINAFALPGGFIGVHTGLIAAARNESELAGVLAHEMAHVTQSHIARMVDAQKGAALSTLAALAVAILASRADQAQLGQAAVVTAQAMTLQNQLDYTREHEREADRVGLQTLNRAGFDARGMATFFERLQMQTRHSESQAPSYLRTHPLTFERIADIQGRLNSLAPHPGEDSQEFRYVRARVRAAQGDAAQALARERATLAEQADAPEALFGAAESALRLHDLTAAQAYLARLEKRSAHPMIATLAARIDFDAGNPGRALERLRQAMQRHGISRALALAYSEALLRAGRASEAKREIDGYLRVWLDEPAFLALLARANFGLGQVAEGHLAQAESLRQQDLLAAALDQLESARKAGGDYYTQSIVDARIRDTRDRLKDEKEQGAKAW